MREAYEGKASRKSASASSRGIWDQNIHHRHKLSLVNLVSLITHYHSHPPKETLAAATNSPAFRVFLQIQGIYVLACRALYLLQIQYVAR